MDSVNKNLDNIQEHPGLTSIIPDWLGFAVRILKFSISALKTSKTNAKILSFRIQ